MKNEKQQQQDKSQKKTDPKTDKHAIEKSGINEHPEGGRGANKNDDPSEDSKGGGNRGLGNQEGANQGNFQGGHKH